MLLLRSIIAAINLTLIRFILFETPSPMTEYNGLDFYQWLATRAPGERIVGDLLRLIFSWANCYS